MNRPLLITAIVTTTAVFPSQVYAQQARANSPRTVPATEVNCIENFPLQSLFTGASHQQLFLTVSRNPACTFTRRRIVDLLPRSPGEQIVLRNTTDRSIIVHGTASLNDDQRAVLRNRNQPDIAAQLTIQLQNVPSDVAGGEWEFSPASSPTERWVVTIPASDLRTIAHIEHTYNRASDRRRSRGAVAVNGRWPLIVDATSPTEWLVANQIRFQRSARAAASGISESNRRWCIRITSPGVHPLDNNGSRLVLGSHGTIDYSESIRFVLSSSLTELHLDLFAIDRGDRCDNADATRRVQIPFIVPALSQSPSYRVPITRTVGSSVSNTAPTRLFLVCDDPTPPTEQNCMATRDSASVVQSNGNIAPRNIRSCALRYFSDCGQDTGELQSFGRQSLRVIVTASSPSGDRELSAQSFHFGADDRFREFNLALVDSADDNTVVRVTARLEDDDTVKYGDQASASDAQFSFTARIMPRGVFGWPIPIRTIVTLPLTPLVVRLPANPLTLRSSTDPSAIQLTVGRAGILLGIEPWDYVNRRPLWPLPVRFVAGAYLFEGISPVYAPAIVAGATVRLPLYDGNDVVNSQLGTSISLGAMLDVDLRGPAPQPSFIITTSIDLLSVFSPQNGRQSTR